MIRAELPGVAREDIQVTFAHGVLTISGERETDLDEDSVLLVHERRTGAFGRSVTLPAGVDEGSIDADFQNGLLQETVRGAASPAPRRIEVRER